MRGVNSVVLIGNATRGAELRRPQTGRAMSSTGLATICTGKGEEEPQFHTILCWDWLAEMIC